MPSGVWGCTLSDFRSVAGTASLEHHELPRHCVQATAAAWRLPAHATDGAGGVPLRIASERPPNPPRPSKHRFPLISCASISPSSTQGGIIGEYAAELQEEEPEKYQRQFKSYVDEGVDPEDLEELYKEVHDAIRADPAHTKKERKKPATATRRVVLRISAAPSRLQTSGAAAERMHSARNGSERMRSLTEPRSASFLWSAGGRPPSSPSRSARRPSRSASRPSARPTTTSKCADALARRRRRDSVQRGPSGRRHSACCTAVRRTGWWGGSSAAWLSDAA